jgi:GNAT superfamily N-acetyltransferase
MHIVSVGESPEFTERAIAYFQRRWASEASKPVYDDCIRHTAADGLPQWYLLMDGDGIAGCAGLITNDFISRMDLIPWLCALYIEPEHRGKALGSQLIHKTKQDAKKAGYARLYLCTGHIGYYEKYGFSYLGEGYHPWGESSRIYGCDV